MLAESASLHVRAPDEGATTARGVHAGAARCGVEVLDKVLLLVARFVAVVTVAFLIAGAVAAVRLDAAGVGAAVRR